MYSKACKYFSLEISCEIHGFVKTHVNKSLRYYHNFIVRCSFHTEEKVINDYINNEHKHY